MKNKFHSFISILLALIFVVGLMPLTSIPAQAKSNIQVVIATANGDAVTWTDECGTPDGGWTITADNDYYAVFLQSLPSSNAEGDYALENLETYCFIADKSAGVPFSFTDGSCTVTVNGEVVNVSGVFKADNNEYYAVDITYGTPSVSFTKVTDGNQITADNIDECSADVAKAWVLANWDELTNTSSSLFNVAFYDGNNLYIISCMTDSEKTEFEQVGEAYAISVPELRGIFEGGDNDVWLCTPAAAPTVTYLDENGDEQECENGFVVNSTNNAALDFECVTVGSLAYGNGFEAGDLAWIIVDGDVTFTNRINVAGTVNVRRRLEL